MYMGSPTVRAQKLANEANIEMTEATNQTNRDIAEQANLYNRENLELQNTWNREQWELENAYNDPSAQMERYIKAGINPLWAMSDISAGNAQHLESGAPAPAEVAHMEAAHVSPEYDPMLAQHIGNINAAAQNIVNGALGFQDMALKAEDVQTRRNAQITRSVLDQASAVEKAASARGKEIEADWNLNTFDVRARAEAQKLDNLRGQLRSLDAGTDEAKAKKLEIEEHTRLVSEQINQVIASVRQRDRELDIMSRNALSLERNAASNERQVTVSENELRLQDERFSKEVEKWNNDTIMQYLYKFGRTNSANMSGKVSGGVGSVGASFGAGYSARETTPADIKKMQTCGLIILERAAADPTEKNLKDAASVSKVIQALQDKCYTDIIQQTDAIQPFNSSTSSVLNPSDDW